MSTQTQSKQNVKESNITETKVIEFPEGLPGFENLTKFIILEEPDAKEFMHLQSVEEKDVSFLITDPYRFKTDYAPIINEAYFEKLGGGADDEFVLYTIACIRENVKDSTLNLAGPILIHTKNKKGIQVVTEDKAYSTKTKIADLVNLDDLGK